MKHYLRYFFLVVLLLSTGILLYRLVFDFQVYQDGATFVIKNNDSEGYDYLLRIPRGIHLLSEPSPVLLFLHGAGESGTDVRTLLNRDCYAQFRQIHPYYDYPFIVISPICNEQRWEPHRVIATLNKVISEHKYRFPLDTSRIYLTGYSMGGFGTFETAMEYPDRFAAIVPVAGGGEPEKAEKLRHMPIWAFHGEDDTTVPLPSSQILIERIKQLDSQYVHFRIFNKAGHNISHEVYTTGYIYTWLLTHSLDNRTGSNPGDLVNRRSAR